MEFGARLDAWLKATGKTRRDLAKHCDVSYSAVCYWANVGQKGKTGTPPSNPNMTKVLEFFGVSMAEFYGRIPKTKRIAA